ncbi:hypothetical protein FNV43_RR11227 [Rhamnella rubrinervis]|uniref:Exostosin GT47 domain-containing protein n=1 Tax=Rhamnella rubrinervis TaxID=2594499 RepID=A0A8K0H5L1_9ROSA|nr:hypothetical protein FNV43_RR11227 [Rhamnella rubrinervis]
MQTAENHSAIAQNARGSFPLVGKIPKTNREEEEERTSGLWLLKVIQQSIEWFSKMGQKLFTLCQVETRTLLWIMGLLFVLVIVFQYFELPYVTVLSSYSAAKFPVSGKSNLQNGDSPSNSEIVDNMSHSNDSNHTGAGGTIEIANNTRSASGFVSGGQGSSNSSLGLDDGTNDAKESSSINVAEQNRSSIPDGVKNVDKRFSPEDTREPEQNSNRKINTSYNNSSMGDIGNGSSTVTSDNVGSSGAGFVSPPTMLPPINSSEYTLPVVVNTSIITPTFSGNSNTSLVEKEGTTILQKNEEKNENSEQLHSDLNQTENTSSITRVPEMNKPPEVPALAVYPISEMNNLLIRSRASYYSVIPQWSSAVDHELEYVTSQIENAPLIQNDPDLYAPLYRNVSMFKRSYELMEDILKVYVYREGKRPVLHTPVLKGIYASEGWFMKQLEVNSHSHKNLIEYLKNYLDMVAAKHPFWNRTGGADHFLVACHDWAPAETRKYMAKCIRALCNSDIKEGFVFGKDVSLPETFVRTPQNPLRQLGGKPPSKRSILAFFAGSMHGYVRPILLQHWENKDADMKIFARLPKSKDNKNYIQYMKNSKYCICAKGYEVNSPRVVEAISYECVPVIISDNYVPPLFDVLNWEAFAVFVMEKDIPNLKNILLSIPEKRYRSMQMRVKRVQQHFLWHAKPVKYDIFHMILHSVWYNRLHQIKPI